MKTNYVTPQVEVIEIELEGVLCNSPEFSDNIDAPDVEEGGPAW